MNNPYFYTNTTKIYDDFKAIDVAEYRSIVRYVEEYRDQLTQLDFEAYFEILVAYGQALFEIGAYERHLIIADQIIEESIINTVKFWQGQDVFYATLFKKAASHYHLGDYKACDHILRELIKIYPNDESTVLFLKRCLRKEYPQIIQNAKATAIFLLLLAAVIIAVELLFVRPFYAMHTGLIETSRTSVFILAVVAIIGGEVYDRYRVHREVTVFVQAAKQKRGIK